MYPRDCSRRKVVIGGLCSLTFALSLNSPNAPIVAKAIAQTSKKDNGGANQLDYAVKRMSQEIGQQMRAGSRDIPNLPYIVALYILAMTNLNKHDAVVGANWLVDHQGDKGQWFAYRDWDAFSDGCINGSHACYGIQMGFIVRSLLDTYVLTREQRFSSAAIRGLDYYAGLFTSKGDAGVFWYSDSVCDVRLVANTQAMLMGQYARAYALFGNSHYLEIANSAYAGLQTLKHDKKGYLAYSYKQGNMRENDLIHAAQTVLGLFDYARNTLIGIPLERAILNLARFEKNGCIGRWPKGSKNKKAASPRAVGMAMFTAAEVGHKDLAAIFYNSLNFHVESGRKSCILLEPDRGLLNMTDKAYLLLGLTSHQASIQQTDK